MARPSILQPLGGPLAGQRLEFSGAEVVVGSGSDCGVRIDAPGIEDRHARIVVDTTGATIHRIDGVVGVNDDVILGDGLLRSGDFVWLGEPGAASSLMLQFTLGDVEEPVAAGIAPDLEEAPSEELVEEVESDDLAPQASAAEEVVEEVVEEEAVPEAHTAEPAEGELMEMAPEPSPPQAAEETLVEELHVDEELHVAEELHLDEELHVDEAPLAATHHGLEPADPEPAYLEPADLDPISELEPSFAETLSELPPAPAPTAVVPPAPWQMPSAPAAPEPAAEYASAWESAPAPAAPVETESTMLLPASPVEAPARPAAAPAPAPPPPPAPPPAPAPKRAAPTPTPKPKPRTADPEAVVRTLPPPPARTTSSTPMVVGGLGLVAVLGIAGFFLLRTPSEPEAPAPTPTPVAAATPVATEPAPVTEPTQVAATEPVPAPVAPPPVVATPVAPGARPAAPTPAPRATPLPARATPAPAGARPGATAPTTAPVAAAPAAPVSQAPRLLEEARAAMAAHDHTKAGQLLDQVLRLEPGNAEATARKAEVDGQIAALARKFNVGATSILGGKAAKGPTGFDLGGGGVVKTDFSAQIRCTTTPASLEPGTPYTVRCSIVNIGTKAFKLDNVTTTETTDGAKVAGAGVFPKQDLAPQSDTIILQKAGTWSAKSQWSMEIVAKTSKDESFRAVYNWR